MCNPDHISRNDQEAVMGKLTQRDLVYAVVSQEHNKT